jgi:putative ABC transport system permease protein
MTPWGLAWRWLWARPGTAVLNLALLSLGVGAMVFVVLTSEQIERALQRDLAGIDLVVGAKGSPMQVILAGVFHIDVPTGNIPWATAATLRAHPMVERAVPVSLGDSVQGFRIVGTTPEWPALYGLAVAQGQGRLAPMQAVLGADVARVTGLAPGARFVGVHGLGREGEAHGDTPYTVAGVWARCGCVADRLVLTAIESVWQVHEGLMAATDEDRQALVAEREVTLLLVGYRTPLAAATLPRWVNAQDGLQAASPALESARLMRMVGVGADVLRGFGAVMLAVAALAVFVALGHAVREREPDLAMLRMLGAPPHRVAALLLAEAGWLAMLGLAIGVALGHGAVQALGLALADDRSLSLTGLAWADGEAAVGAGTLVLALAAAAPAAWRALRLDVTTLLHDAR